MRATDGATWEVTRREIIRNALSIGIAVANSGVSNPQQLLEEADAAMYFEKRKHKQS